MTRQLHLLDKLNIQVSVWQLHCLESGLGSLSLLSLLDANVAAAMP
jgi:hypothetical protein